MNNINKIIMLTLALVIFAAALFLYRPVQNRSTRVTVSGDSQTQVLPDNAVVSFSVVTQNAQAVGAQQENARKIEAVIKALQDISNGARLNIETSSYSLSPEHDYSSSRMPKIVGYEARNTISVTTDNLNQVGALIDAATKAGVNSVEGISFVLREDSPTRGNALGIATRQAMAKAEAIAKSLNGRVVRVVETIEGGVLNVPVSSFDNFAATNTNAMSNAAYSTQIQAGSLTVRAQVTLVAEVEVDR